DWFYRQCDLVLPPTEAVGLALAERGMPRQRTWSRGVDTELFRPQLRDLSLRNRLLDGGDVLALTVSRLSHEKRIGVVISALAGARARRPGLRLVVVGDGPARAELEESAADGMRFVGELHGEQLARVYASADLFCLTSTTETFGQVLLEAAASGLPVIASAAGGAIELVEHEQTGLLVHPTDLPGYIDTLVRLADSRDERTAFGAAGREAAMGRTWERSFDQLGAAYRAAALQTEEIDRRQLLLV